MANFWQGLKRIASNLGTGRLLSRLPKSLKTLARTGEALSRTQQAPAQRPGRLPMPTGWAPTPPGPSLEPPVLAEIVTPSQRDLSALAKAPTPKTEEEAEDFLDRVADAITRVDVSKLTPAQRQAIQRLEQIQRQYRQSREAAARELQADIGDDEGQMIQTYGRGIWSRGETDELRDLMSREILTPESSNVYSFVYEAAEQGEDAGMIYSPSEAARQTQWERQHAAGTWRGPYRYKSRFGRSAGGILYVTFKAWNPGQSERPNSPGPTYAYYDVPMDKFRAFASDAQHSAGAAVWDYLRVRETVHGHQHPYRLVAGQKVAAATMFGGKLVQAGGRYIPRKATVQGYARRTLAQPGYGGGRGGRASTMAPSVFGGPKNAKHQAKLSRLRRWDGKRWVATRG